MKFYTKYNSGLATLEIVIALGIITLAIAALILISFGNQTIATENEINNDALYRTRNLVENGRAEIKNNFYADINATSSEDIFNKSITALDINVCKRRVIGTVNWETEASRSQHIEIKTDVISINEAEALDGDCGSDNPPISEWWYPNTFKDYDLKTIDPPSERSSNAGVPATSIDIIKKNSSRYAILTTAHNSENDLWLININDPLNAFVAGSVETTERGLNTADATQDLAFALSRGSWDTQPSELHIIDISSVVPPYSVATKSLDILGIDQENNPNANSIYYYDGKVYVGTHKTGGKEFQIFSGIAPYSKIAELEITHNINSIIVRGDYAYFATSDDTGEFMAVNINPASPDYMIHPDITGMKYDTTKDFDAISLYLLGNKAYLGRDGGNYNNTDARNFVILDISDLNNIAELGSKFIPSNAGPNKAVEVLDLFVVGDFAFISTDDDNFEFQVYRVGDPSDIYNCDELDDPQYPDNCGKYNFPAKMVDLEFDDNLIYSAVESNATFRVIFDDLSQY
ncbi:MAG: hypothetical protein COV29_03530 [Candidatus Yanofskybacteria bacterium CG10_big_fil_rev_8_21_14_0_10_36_16]|uniref:Uncharacterized protein n=1 Tax=Candidatus Yanofskybacteria bacterium CG10_big_fil_rev_8_21_14_0_10_36_16 TaxID=1975096 RepID=A0A2J0Q741_9BACT|nr:MAG: hypothetical protein COV29_03530 [Candidatus Yanofskybacteria bacterium CG10_big_fil_rev_8_21_14_0_10_36_16]